MKVSEVFCSIQGEGPQVGMVTNFIRLSGCNLSCDWCDSKYAQKGKEMSIQQIIESLNSHCRNVVITGGEPFIHKDLYTLIKSLSNYNIYIESNGTIFDSRLIGIATFIISPKLEFLNDDYVSVLKKWSIHSTFKFVIETVDDFDHARFLCERLEKFDDVYFMPKGTEEEQLKKNMLSLAKLIKDIAPWIRLSPRLQIYLWGNKRGT